MNDLTLTKNEKLILFSAAVVASAVIGWEMRDVFLKAMECGYDVDFCGLKLCKPCA